MNFWLMKTEPDAYSFEDLVKAGSDCWDGIRNYQARNMLRDDFKVGDQVLIYHSRIDQPKVVGIAEVTKEAYPDDTAMDPQSKYFDPKSAEKGESRWVMVDLKACSKLQNPVTLKEIRETKVLSKMLVIKKGMRLSIQPVTRQEFNTIKKMGLPVDV